MHQQELTSIHFHETLLILYIHIFIFLYVSIFVYFSSMKQTLITFFVLSANIHMQMNMMHNSDYTTMYAHYKV